MDGGLEAAHVLHGHALPIARLQVLVQDGDDLVIEDLELANSLYHLLQRLQQLTHWDFHISSVNHSKLLTTYAISLTQLLKQQIRLAFKQISLLVSCCQLDFLAQRTDALVCWGRGGGGAGAGKHGRPCQWGQTGTQRDAGLRVRQSRTGRSHRPSRTCARTQTHA